MTNKYANDGESRPGDRVVITGKYQILSSNGKPTNQFRYCEKNDKFPPTPKINQVFKLEKNIEIKKK